MFTVTPKARLALSANARITASLPPPGGQGAIRVMGLLGKLLRLLCAKLSELKLKPAKPVASDCSQ